MPDARTTAIVTGATGAIGGAIARGLSALGYRVIIIVRDRSRGERMASSIEKETHHPVEVELCDVSLQSQVIALKQRLPEVLDVLVNNAAECPRSRQVTEVGIERQWATNVLGYHWLMRECAEALAASPRGRIVNVASYWAGGLDLADVEFRRRRYDNDDAYRQSKQADRMLSAAYAEHLKPRGIHVYSCHPGDVRSKLSSDLGFGGHESPAAGADTPIWLASASLDASATGRYFAHRRAEPCRFSANRKQVEALFDLCASYD
jgi:NAD(P)-dependent dehydrogenase (short-subunit alcohol dehydrogenase family)